ncbi:MAG TPA: CDP-alcohol phosphatidyltransferase family protein [bacterium]|nr:CDP-alcohol phosphatidyltransferase family protein [bacterium]
MTVADAGMDRRPVPARRWPVLRRIAGELARRGVSPNVISVAGMLCGAGAGGLFVVAAHAAPFVHVAWVAAAALIAVRATANVLDGLVAVEFGGADPAGILYNEVPDRVSDAAMLIGLGYAQGSSPELGYLAAYLAVLTAYVRATGKIAGAPQEYGGPMGKQQRMAVAVLVALCYAFSPVGWMPAAAVFRPAFAGLLLIVAGSAWTVIWRLRRIAFRLAATRTVG